MLVDVSIVIITL